MGLAVTNAAQSQTAIRQLADTVNRCANGLDQLENTLMVLTRQITAIERMIANKLDSTDGTD